MLKLAQRKQRKPVRPRQPDNGARAARGSFPYPHRTVAEAIPLPDRQHQEPPEQARLGERE